MPRNRLLAIAAAYRALLLALLAIFALTGLEPLWVAFVLIALAGVGHSFETPSTQALVTDSVPRRRRDERGRAAVGRRPREWEPWAG